MTIIVAGATLLLMGGILAGPAILDCAKDGSKFAACLRDKIAESGLIAPEGEAVEKQILTSEMSSAEPSVERPIVAETPRPAGWLDANAREYGPKPPAPAVLTGVPARLMAEGDAPPPKPVPNAEIALTQSPGSLSASGSTRASRHSAGAAITSRTGDLLASGGSTADAIASIDVELTAPAGELSATGQEDFRHNRAVVSITALPSKLLAKGEAEIERDAPAVEVTLAGPANIPTASMATSEPPAAPTLLTLRPGAGGLTAVGIGTTNVAIEANASLERLSTGIPLATGSIGVDPRAPTPISLKASVASPTVQLMPDLPKPVIEFNPSFPNVLVLPPPHSGEDSSFLTLELN